MIANLRIVEAPFFSSFLSSSVWAAITKCHSLGGFKPEKFIPLSSGGWEVQDQGATWLGEDPFSGPELVPSGCVLSWRGERGFRARMSGGTLMFVAQVSPFVAQLVRGISVAST